MAPETLHRFLASCAVKREHLEAFLADEANVWACFDPELGYLLRTTAMRDGMDRSYALYSYYRSGARRLVNYAGDPCRINTYGDSFTQCHQVSDGETWQEYLAAHLGEPVRNFGIGGYGVYQAYRRMLREEATSASAPYVILNMWEDDHRRSLMCCRWIQLCENAQALLAQKMFHSAPWVHVQFNPDTGTFDECPSLCPTPNQLLQMSDPDFMVETFRSRPDVHFLAARIGLRDADTSVIREIAEALNLSVDFSNTDATARTASAVWEAVTQRSGIFIANKAREFAGRQGKKLLIMLTYSDSTVAAACHAGPRHDQALLDDLTREGFTVFDGLEAHVRDYQAFRCSPEDYVKRFYIGHYNPLGNHFLAYALKDTIVRWLSPPPITYRGTDPDIGWLAAKLA